MKLTFNWLMELVELPEAVGLSGPTSWPNG